MAGRGVPPEGIGVVLDGVDWKDGLADALAQTASLSGADRCYAFENLRGPDGRLWMDLIGEWTGPEVRSLVAVAGANLHPYHPEFQAWIDIFDGGDEIVGPVAEMPATAGGEAPCGGHRDRVVGADHPG